MLKMISAPRAGQTDMVVQTRFGTRIFEVGKVEDMGPEEAAAILGGQFGKCFERVEQAGKPTAQAKAVVHAARSTVKAPSALVEDDAAEEATKMVSSKDYKVK